MSRLPLHDEIYNKILNKLKNGDYGENCPLPSERTLCEQYHVSRSTIRQALTSLQNKGYIYKVQGTGTFVSPQIFEQPLLKFYSFTDELRNSNITIQNCVINYEQIKLPYKLSQKLNVESDMIFHKIVRLRSAKDYPLMIETTYLPKNRFIKINTEILNTVSLYGYLKEKYDLQVDKATETFRPVVSNNEESKMLCVPPKTSCMLLERFSYEENSLVEYTCSIVRGDKYIFKIDLLPSQ